MSGQRDLAKPCRFKRKWVQHTAEGKIEKKKERKKREKKKKSLTKKKPYKASLYLEYTKLRTK